MVVDLGGRYWMWGGKDAIDGTIIITHKLSEKWKKVTCAVVAKEKCFFIEPDGTINESNDIPAGGMILVD